jgi:hypothetical protein
MFLHVKKHAKFVTLETAMCAPADVALSPDIKG